MNQSVIIINIKPLYEILNEINNNFSYKLVHLNTKEFDENFNKEDKQFDNSIFIIPILMGFLNMSGGILFSAITKKYSYGFTVTRIGIEEAIYNFAFDFPFLYGLISLTIAAITGWAGAELFRRFRKS